MGDESRTVRVGRPTTSPSTRRSRERRIALAALDLFESEGLAVTTVADIAARADTSVRTFWRHFSSKEDAVRPLLEEGLRDAVARLGNVARGQSLADAWANPSPAELDDVRDVVRLLRLAAVEPVVNAVWLQVHHDATDALALAIAHHEGRGESSLAVRVRAAVLNAALAEAIAYYANEATPAMSIGDVVAEAVRYAVDRP